MITEIIKQNKLLCTEQQFQTKLDATTCPDKLTWAVTKGKFDVQFEGHTLDNPTSNTDAMWYALEESTFNYRYLQTQAPLTLETLTADNIDTIVENHKQDLTNEHEYSYRIGKTIEHFLAIKPKQEKVQAEEAEMIKAERKFLLESAKARKGNASGEELKAITALETQETKFNTAEQELKTAEEPSEQSSEAPDNGSSSEGGE